MDHFSPLVSVDWLAANLGRPEIRILDCTVHLHPLPGGDMRTESGLADFAAGHIPGAGFADLIEALSDPESPLRFTLPDAERFATAMGRLGAGPDSHLILYADPFYWATRLWWMLRHFGFDRASVLDVGPRAWQAAGHDVETGPAAPVRPKDFTITTSRDLFCDSVPVRAAIGAGDIVTINALLPQQHAGTGGADYGRPGRIPGSVCVPARNLVDRETGWFRPLADLRADFATVGALKASTVITYCGGGIAASGDAFVLHLLGQDSVQIYDASLQEWARSELPMETDTAVA